MLPDKNHPNWISLLKGDINHNFKSISASMMLSRLERQLKRDNYTKEAMSNCIDEAYEFFKKFQTLFEEDLKEIFK